MCVNVNLTLKTRVYAVMVVSAVLSVNVALVNGMPSLTLVQTLSTRGSSTHNH